MPQPDAENPFPLRFVVHPQCSECELVTPPLFPPERRGPPFREFTYPSISLPYAMGKHPGIASAMESPMTCWSGEPKLAEMLTDPIVEAIMAADGVDPQQLLVSLHLVSLRNTAPKVVQLPHERESGDIS
jgi:hypothetical protein